MLLEHAYQPGRFHPAIAAAAPGESDLPSMGIKVDAT
jgi:hypothetical protein